MAGRPFAPDDLSSTVPMRQLPLPLGSPAEPDFGSFVPGRNAAVLAHLMALDMPAAPVYLWGPSGSGKSHLLGALARSVRRAGGRAASFGATASAPWALTEDCFFYDWCEQMLPFISAGKPVFAAEYTDMGMTLNMFCPSFDVWGFSGILKQRDLTAWLQACP